MCVLVIDLHWFVWRFDNRERGAK